MMATVRYDQATRIFPRAERPAVDALTLEIPDGEFLVLVGPSGCGKSTSLRMLAGLEEIDSGTVWIGDRDVCGLPPKSRDVAMVFQNYALYPHMTVAENIGFALKLAHMPRAEIKSRVAEAAKMLDLEEYLGRKPKALSGGQRQRVAMGRAIVRQPQVFLLDEPLSNLDAKLRVQTRTQIASLQRRLGVTTVYVTHDQVEAMTMGDRVAVLDRGLLQQVDTPRELFTNPANMFVAGFIGSPAMNLQEVPIADGNARFEGYHVPLPRAALGKVNGRVVIGFRPESLELVENGEPGIELTVQAVEELGSDAYVYGSLGDTELVKKPDVIARIDPAAVPAKGSRIKLKIRPDRLHLFAAGTGERLDVS
jgi:multiple sugar transport system ATP-binding protein